MSTRLLHRMSQLAIGVALVTLTFGALVTSKRAGMAFTDWPTSDGKFMLTYPWLADLFARNWDKFLEHTHRLAGIAIGIWSILLVVIAMKTESRRWVIQLTIGILLGIICQGLLGGFRVRLDERLLAMLHGIFAGVVFSLLGVVSVVTSRTWRTLELPQPVPALTSCKVLSVSLLVISCLQYVLGSLIRHQGSALHEHLGLGMLVLILSLGNLFAAFASRQSWLKRSALSVLVIVLGQVALGLAAWAFKYGVPFWGYVAIADSIQQVVFRTAHMVLGTVTILAGVVHLLKVFRVAAVSPSAPEQTITVHRLNPQQPMAGGAS